MDPYQADKLDQIIGLLKQIAEQTRPEPKLTISMGDPVSAQIVHDPSCQIIQAMGGWWSILPPPCTCGAIRYAPQSPTFTTDSTGTDFRLTHGEDD